MILLITAACAAPPPPSPTASPARPTVGPRINPARHYNLAAAPNFWLKGDTPPHRDDPVLRHQLLTALDADFAVQRVPYEARRLDQQPIVSIVFAAGDQPVQAFVYRPDEGRLYVIEDAIAFAPPAALRSALAPLFPRSGPAAYP